MKKEIIYRLSSLCIFVVFSTTFIFANIDASFHPNNTKAFYESSAYRITNDTILECDDMDCTNGVETWNPVTCECESGIPPSSCSACYNQEAGTACDNGDSNTYNDTWQEVMPDFMRYRVAVNCTWDSLSPGWPDQNAHFSWIGGGTHNANVKFWEVGTLASPGVDMMSVNGVTTLLVEEVEAEIANGNAEYTIQQQHWFCPDAITHPNCGQLWFDIIVSRDFPLVTLASMLGPSPDWFIGTESLSVLDSTGAFISQIVHELYPHDAGILSDNSVLESDCCAREPLSVPQQNIHLITEESGELIGPESLGQITLTAFPDPLDCACVSDPAGAMDNDGDGFPLAEDCDDDNVSVNPDQTEIPYNGLDDDCNATTLDDDLDQDGYPLAEDCNDDNALINPDAEEIPNNEIDEDCDGNDLMTTIHEISNTKINIFPNPVSTQLQIQINASLDYQILIFDLNGKLLLKEENQPSIDVNEFSNGIYLMEIIDNKTKEKIVEKIVVAK